MENRYLRYVAPPATVCLGGLFAYAGFVKWRDPQVLADSIEAYRLSLGNLNAGIAILLPPAEIFAALALIHPKTRSAGLFVILGLSAVFFGALAQAFLRGFEIDCGCFGSEAPSRLGMVKAMLRDASILTASVWLLKRDVRCHEACVSEVTPESRPISAETDAN